VAGVRIRRAEDIQDLARAAHDAHRRDVVALLPAAEDEHVGATAVPGALTKGDVDLLVRASEREFAEAVSILRNRYVIHQLHNWTRTLASFKAPAHLRLRLVSSWSLRARTLTASSGHFVTR